ncbi:MAG TPA: cell wall-binding repeat-containing protein, partial [Acidimicrobiales bacterium]|nr:cell wall-binding repeat-containing protein [Acidimicrobiales bacterium]
MQRAVLLVTALAASLTVPSTSPAGADASGRVAGADRYATAAAVSAATFPAGVPAAFLVTGGSYPDALTAGPAAARAGGPVLLTGRDTLPAVTAAELDRLRPGRIVVVGGTGAVSESVRSALERHTDGAVTRVSGADRYATAAAVSAAAFEQATTVYVASGERFPDALAGGPAAFRDGAPLLLVTAGGVPSTTAAEIRRLGATRAVILGGTGSVGPGAESQLRALVSDVVRVAGDDRFATSAAVALRTFAPGVATAYLATGAGFADALAAGAAAAVQGAPVLLVRGNCIPPSVNHALAHLRPSRTVLLGGTAVLGTGVERLGLCPYSGATLRTPAVATRPGPVWDQPAPDPHL